MLGSRLVAAPAFVALVMLVATGGGVDAATDDARIRVPRYTAGTARSLDRALLERLGTRSGAKEAMGNRGWLAFLATTSASNRAASARQVLASAKHGRSRTSFRAATSGAEAFTGVIDGLLADGKLYGKPTNEAPQGADISDGSTREKKTYDSEGNPIVVKTDSVIQKNFNFFDEPFAEVLVNAVMDATTTVTDDDGNVLSTVVTQVSARFEVATCPKEDGRVNILGATEASQSVNGGVPATTSLNVTATGWVGEDAYLQEITWEGEAGAGDARVATSGNVPSNRNGAPVFGDLTVNLADGSNGDLATFQTQLAETTFDLASTMAQDRWRSGACTEIRTDVESRNVPPGSDTSITTTVWHRKEKRELAQDIDVDFSGDEALAPDSGKHAPPFTLKYKAGPDDGDKGTITLESTSRRGKTKKTLTFTAGVRGYRINASSGTYGNFTVSGVSCGKDHPERGPWNLDTVDHLPVIGDTPGKLTITIEPDGTGTMSGGDANAAYDVSWSIAGTVVLERSPSGGWQIRVTKVDIDVDGWSDYSAFFPQVLELTDAEECG